MVYVYNENIGTLAEGINGKIARNVAWRQVESGEISLEDFRESIVIYPDGMVVTLERW